MISFFIFVFLWDPHTKKKSTDNTGRKTQAKQQGFSRKYKLPSWSPSSSGRTHSCKKREEAEMSSGPVTVTQHFWFLPTVPAWQGINSAFLSRKIIETNSILFMCWRCERVPGRQGNRNRSNQKKREEYKSTYLPLHRRLHAASVQSKSRTEIISGRTGQPAPVLFMMHSLWSTFTNLGCSYS